MKTQRRASQWLATSFVMMGLAGGLCGCNGGGGTPMPVTPGMNYTVRNLVSDGGANPYTGPAGAAATYTDANLVNGWGLAFNPAGFVWVADNATSKSTLYDGNGVPQSLVVSLPAGQAGTANPTGIVFNSSQDFMVSQGGVSAASVFIFVGESGTISGWSPTVSSTTAINVADGAGTNKVYKGAALASYSGNNYLYATDFHNSKIDVFDKNFVLTSLPGGFKDPSLPAGYAPYGIAAIGGQLYVSFGMQDAQAHDEVAGAGLGFVDVFDTAGNLVKQLIAGGKLNASWGMTMAPANFGAFSNDLLVANFGDGKINAYNPTSGAFVGTLSKSDGTAISIDGLWGIAFGNGINNQPTNTLFFTAGPADEAHGLYGRIDAQ